LESGVLQLKISRVKIFGVCLSEKGFISVHLPEKWLWRKND